MGIWNWGTSHILAKTYEEANANDSLYSLARNITLDPSDSQKAIQRLGKKLTRLKIIEGVEVMEERYAALIQSMEEINTIKFTGVACSHSLKPYVWGHLVAFIHKRYIANWSQQLGNYWKLLSSFSL